MKVIITGTNGLVHEFKARNLDVRLDSGMFILFDGNTREPLFITQQQFISEVQLKGKPKPPKQPNPKSCDQALEELKRKAETLEGRLDNFTQRFENVCDELVAAIEHVQKLIRFCGGESILNDSGWTAMRQYDFPVPAIHEPIPPMSGPAPLPEPTDVASPVTIPSDEVQPTDDNDYRRVQTHQRTRPNGPCDKCHKYQRHAVHCAYLTEDQVQDAQCENVPVQPE